MARVEALKNELQTMHDLEDLTNVLEQVAARDIALMRKRIIDSRPFFQHVWRIYRVVQSLSPPPPEVVHKHLVVAVALDWGMPGSLLNRVLDKAMTTYEEHGADLLIAGKMAHNRFQSKTERTVHFFNFPKDSQLSEFEPIYKVISKYAHVTYVFPQFQTLSLQEVVTVSVSARSKIALDDAPENRAAQDIESNRFLFEPGIQEISNYLNEVIVGATVHHHFAEAALAYNAAQMVAMRNAYDNAKDEAKIINLRYNKARREQVDTKLRELYGSRPIASKGL